MSVKTILHDGYKDKFESSFEFLKQQDHMEKEAHTLAKIAWDNLQVPIQDESISLNMWKTHFQRVILEEYIESANTPQKPFQFKKQICLLVLKSFWHHRCVSHLACDSCISIEI